MPFSKAQAVLKKVLPEKAFDELYKVACNGFDVLQSVRDKIYYSYPIKDYDEWCRRRFCGLVAPYSMVSRAGLLGTYDAAMDVTRQGLEGAFVECGVARGGCSALMAIIARNEKKGRKT